MKTIYTLILIFLIQSLNAQFSDVRMYAMGHSLMDHVASPPVPDTNIMYWINDIAQHANNTFATGGQFGFITNHDNLPPASNWGYSGITGVWDDNTQSFSDANVNTLLLTVANFIQYELPTNPHPLDNSTTVVQSTETIFDWVNTQESGVRYYIYANWPEMDLASDFPPTPPLQSEIDTFHNTTIAGFTDWWKLYQDEMLSSRPALNTRLIPVGMIISKILRDVIPNQISFDDLYEDSAPHGKASVYFLAGMITYMATYQQNIPSTYVPSNSVNTVIINNLPTIKSFVWSELNAFNLPNGESRVFYSTANTNDLSVNNDVFTLYPNPANNSFKIDTNFDANFSVEIFDVTGRLCKTFNNINANTIVEVSNLTNGVYYVNLQHNNKIYIKKIIIE